MCGIVGIFATGAVGALSEADLTAMRDRMAWRGPDDAGLYVHRTGDLFVGLGHRRLSIIDLSPLGHQPMATADGRLWIVLNGEIFNYRDLRRELEQAGRWEFRSHTDTEVLLYGIRHWGLEGCLERLRGMYAFALFDQMECALTLVRDPLGVKPLYYMREPARLVFASEIKALLAMPGIEARLHEPSLHHYLTFAHAPAPDTFFAGIKKLEAGTYLRLDRTGQAISPRYWDPTRYVPTGPQLAEQDYVEELRRLLRQSVARRLVADVPVGVFLSGGLDSSLTVALMAEQRSQPIRTYTIGLQGDPANECAQARLVAERFGAEHRELLISEEDMLAFLPGMAYAQDEPLADPVCVPLYYLSRLARQAGTPVIQVGEGSDELFAGYPIYHLFRRLNARAYRPYLAMPKAVRALIYAIARHRVPAAHADLFRRASIGDPLFVGNAIAFWDHEKARLLKEPIAIEETSSGWIRRLADRSGGVDPLTQMIHVELTNRLPELLLMRVDKMSMAASIEARVPYLDEDVVRFALTIPAALKFRHGEAKYLLKKAAEPFLPSDTIYRRKWGFCGSASTMLKEKIIWYAHARILESPLIRERFDLAAIERLFLRQRRRPRFNNFKIWNLLNLVLWHECWIARRDMPPFQSCNAALPTQPLQDSGNPRGTRLIGCPL
jgi:asparagine synthase (glutamine-hydrolysing)